MRSRQRCAKAMVCFSTVILCTGRDPTMRTTIAGYSSFPTTLSQPPPVFENQDHHTVKPMLVVPDNALRTGNFEDIFGRTPIQDMTDRTAEGASIIYGEDFPDLS